MCERAQVARQPSTHGRVAAIAHDLTLAEQAQLLNELRGVRDSEGRESQQETVALCRFLLALESTREDAIVTCVRLMQDRRLSDSAALNCLPELRTAIQHHVGAARARANDGQALVATAAFVQRMCDALLGFLEQPGVGNTARSQLRGHIQALDLLPTTLDACCSPEIEESRATAVRRVLDIDWPPVLLLPLFTALSEVQLSHKERQVVYDKVEAGVDGSWREVGMESDAVGLVQVAIEGVERFQDPRAMRLVRWLVHMAPAAVRSDVLCVVQMALQNGTIELAVVLDSVERSAGGEDASDGWARHGVDSGGAAAEPGSKVRVLDLCASDLTLLLSAANNLLVRDAILETIIGALRRHRKGRGLAATCRLLAAVVECSQAVWLSTLLLDLAECLLTVEYPDAADACAMVQVFCRGSRSAAACCGCCRVLFVGSGRGRVPVRGLRTAAVGLLTLSLYARRRTG